jgi:tetratricopeptide (TPR) repeat protein
MKTRNNIRAEKLFKLGRYSEVIKILEPEVFKNRENENFYYYLGMSCLFLGDYSGANSYLRRSLQINPSNSETMLGLAVIHLKYNKPSEAIRIWLDILDKDAQNNYAKRALNLIKKEGALETVPEDFLVKNLHRLIPYKNTIILYKTLRLTAFILTALVVSVLLFFTAKIFIEKFNKSKNLLPELTISRDIKEIIGTGAFSIELQGREIVDSFETAKKLFIDNKDNLARVEVNRLLNSNASESVKEKARLLDSYLREPDFRYFQNTITFNDVIKEPYLYDNCFVKWSGKIANIRIYGNYAGFDLLVGYESGTVLEGIINVTADFPVLLDEEFTYDIIGRLKTEEKLTLKAVTLRNYIK